MKQIAERVQKRLNGEKTLFVRPFVGFGSANMAMTKTLVEELKRLGFSISVKAEAEIDGRIFRITKKLPKGAEFVIGYKVAFVVAFTKNSQQTPLDTVEVLNHNEAIAVVAETGEVRSSPQLKLQPARTDPSVVDGTRIYPRPNAPYSLEVLVDNPEIGYLARKIDLEAKAFPSVALKTGDLYALKVYNDTDYEAAILVSIDGLSRFALSDKEQYRKSLDIIEKRGSRTIKGYFRDNRTVDAFKVGTYSNSVAAKMLPNPDCGDISVMFRAAWKEGEAPPPGESELPIASPPGTEQGPRLVDETVAVKRNIGNIRAVVRVRY